MNEREKLAEALGDIRVADARQADWWTNDEEHALLIRVLRGECVPWAEGLIAAGWVSPETLAERVAREREAVLDEVYHRRWVCEVFASGYHNGATCGPKEPHGGWGCGYQYVAPRLTEDEYRDLRATTQDGER